MLSPSGGPLSCYQKQQQKMLKGTRPPRRHQLLNSYLLTGLNIRRVINEETQVSVSEFDNNFTGIGRRVNARLKEAGKQWEPNDKENMVKDGSLPCKTFKIRSNTRKVRQAISGRTQEDSQIFQKMQHVRNYKSVGTRLDRCNLRNQNRASSQQNTKQGASPSVQQKIKQILQRQAALKCKQNPMTFIEEHIKPSQPLLPFRVFNSEPFRQIALRTNIHVNPCQDNDHHTLLIIELESIQPRKNKANSSSTKIISEESLQLIRSISEEAGIRVSIKVRNTSQMEQVRECLQANKVSSYHSIFWSVGRYVELWGLYQIDQLLDGVQKVVVMGPKYRMQSQFPILSNEVNCLFLTTSSQNSHSISKAITALKHTILDNELRNQEQDVSQCISWGIRDERLDVKVNELQAKLSLIQGSQAMKECLRMRRKTLTSKGMTKRRVLCERSTNVLEGNVPEEEPAQNGLSWHGLKRALLEQVSTYGLLGGLGTNRQKALRRDCSEVDSLTNEVTGAGPHCRSAFQLAAEIAKSNVHIHKQITAYITGVSTLGQWREPIEIFPLYQLEMVMVRVI